MDSGDGGGCRLDVEAYVYLALMVLIGSSTATAAKFAVRELPIALVPVVRFGGAGLCLLPLVWRRDAWRRMARESGGRLLASAALCVPINQSFFLSASRLAPTTHVGIVYSTCPLVVLGLAVGLGQEKLVWGRLLGIVACVLGVVVVGAGNLWQWGPESAGAFEGDLLLVGAVISWGGYLTVTKPLIARHGALLALAGTFLLGSVLVLPLALATYPTWGSLLTEASPAAWRSLAYLTLVVTVLGLAFQNQALRRFDASQVAAVGNAAPLLTIIWGAWLLGESITPALLLGAALTGFGILWTSRPSARANAGLVVAVDER